ncbi:MAG TPA: tetratricopeptide repeat protein [Jatrophihabitantaceae bacterium]|nr:tetratricopeptide repeat protein [Jatrophihabitantaceae bacterium]
MARTALEGRDGRLFLSTNADLDVLRLHTDSGALREEVVAGWAGVLRRRRERFAQSGIAYLTLVTPAAHVVYADQLPADTTLAPLSPFQRVAAQLDALTAAQCVYPLAELIAGRAEQDTFQPVDSEWTDWGAWLAYLALMRALRPTLPNLSVLDESDLEWSSREVSGSLGSVVSPQRRAIVRTARVRTPRSRLAAHVVDEARAGFTILVQERPELPTAVVFSDATTTPPAKYLSESFRRVMFVTSPNCVYFDLIDRERPDVVIHHVAEHGLVDVPVEPSFTDFRATYGDLVVDDPQAMADQRRSRVLLRSGRTSEALVASDDVLARFAPNARMMVHRARLHIELGDMSSAAEALRHATTLDPGDGAPWFFLGQVLAARGNLDQSARAYARAVDLEPDQAVFWPAAVHTALAAGQIQLGLALAARGWPLHPSDPALAHALSRACLAGGRLPEAEAAARTALALRPGSLEYERHLAGVLGQMSNSEGAS